MSPIDGADTAHHSAMVPLRHDVALLLLLLIVVLPHTPGSSSSTDGTAAQQLEALAKQMPALAAWAAEAEGRLAQCCSCEGRTPPGLQGAGAETLVAVTREDIAIWLWRTAVGIIVAATTYIVVPRDKHVRVQRAQTLSSTGRSNADVDSSTDLTTSLGEWAAAQQAAWVQPSAPKEPGSALHPSSVHASPLGQPCCDTQPSCGACAAMRQKILPRQCNHRVSRRRIRSRWEKLCTEPGKFTDSQSVAIALRLRPRAWIAWKMGG